MYAAGPSSSFEVHLEALGYRLFIMGGPGGAEYVGERRRSGSSYIGPRCVGPCDATRPSNPRYNVPVLLPVTGSTMAAIKKNCGNPRQFWSVRGNGLAISTRYLEGNPDFARAVDKITVTTRAKQEPTTTSWQQRQQQKSSQKPSMV